jgi:DNA-binding XRE family transcriptional regulator
MRNWRENMRALREDRGFKWSWLARKTGIPVSTLHRWFDEKGDGTEPGITDALKIVRALRLSLDYVFGDAIPDDEMLALFRSTIAQAHELRFVGPEDEFAERRTRA